MLSKTETHNPLSLEADKTGASADLGKLTLGKALKKLSAESRQSRKAERAEARRHADLEHEFQKIDRSKQVIGQAVVAADRIKKHDFDVEPLATYPFKPFGIGSLENIAELTLSELTGKDSTITRLIDEDPRNIMKVHARDPYWRVEQLINKGRKQIAYLAQPTLPDESYDARLLIVAGPEFESGVLLVAQAGSGADFYGAGTEIATNQYKQEQKEAVYHGLTEV